MDNVIEEIGLYFWVILVGLVGGLLNMANSGKKGAQRLVNLVVGTASSFQSPKSGKFESNNVYTISKLYGQELKVSIP